MPLVKFDLIEGRDEKSLKNLLDASHRAIVKSFGVPERDRYQIVHQHPAHELIIEDTGLDFERSKNLVIVSVTSKQRSNDIMISIVTNEDDDWSFGLGEAQFLTRKL